MARCACKQTCSCLIQAGDCIVDPIFGTGALDNPYIINVEVLPNGGITCTPGGLSASIVHQDTPCIHLTGDGGANPLTATIQIDPDEPDPNGGANSGNGITCTANGLQVKPSSDTGNIIHYGTDGDLFAVAGTVILGDTDNDNCVNTTVVEAPVGTFTVESSIIIAPDADGPGGNGVTCTPTGLQVIPSTDPGNQVSFGTDGNLFVNVGAAGSITADNTDESCIDVVIGSTGPGTFTVAAHPNLDPAGHIICTPAGLAVTCAPVAITSSTQVGTPCISTSGDGCTSPLNVVLGVSPDVCQGLQCRGNGLWAETPPPNVDQGQAGACFGGLGIVPGLNRNPFGPTMTQVLTNPSQCRSMAVTVTMEARDFDVVNKTGPGVFTVNGELQFNGGGFNVWGFHRSNTPGTYTMQLGTYNREIFTIPPGGSVTVDGKATVSSDGGAQGGTVGGCIIIDTKGVYI